LSPDVIRSPHPNFQDTRSIRLQKALWPWLDAPTRDCSRPIRRSCSDSTAIGVFLGTCELRLGVPTDQEPRDFAQAAVDLYSESKP